MRAWGFYTGKLTIARAFFVGEWTAFVYSSRAMPKKKKKTKKVDKFTRFTRRQWLVGAAVALLAALLVTQMYSVYKLRHQLAFIDSLEKNNSQVIEELGLASEYLTEFGGDLNQIRQFLLLPTSDYNFSNLGDVDFEEDEDVTALVFKFVDTLAEYTVNEERYQGNLEVLEVFMEDPIWSENGLYLEGGSSVYVGDELLFAMRNDNQTILTMVLSNNGRISANTYIGEIELTDPESAVTSQVDITLFLGEKLPAVYNSIAAVDAQKDYLNDFIFPDEKFQQVLVDTGLSMSDAVDASGEVIYQFSNADLTPIAQLKILKSDGTLWIGEKIVPEEETGGVQVISGELLSLDTRTRLEVLVDERVAEMEALMEDKVFKKSLNKLGWEMGEAVEDEERISYPIYDGDGGTLRLIYIDKSTGEVKVEWPGVSAEPIAMAIESLSSKKKVWKSPTSYLSEVA